MGKKLLPLYYALGIAVLASFVLVYTGIFDGMELKMLDFRYYMRHSDEYQEARSPQDIVIISVDQKSLDNIGKWPWRRIYYSRLIEILRKEKAKAIFFDFYLIHEDSNHPDDDQELIKLVKETDNVYFDFYFYNRLEKDTSGERLRKTEESLKALEKFSIPYEDEEKFFSLYSDIWAPFPALAQVVKGAGHANIEPNRLDGILRKAPLLMYYKGRLYPTIVLQMYLDLTGKTLDDLSFDLGHWRGENELVVGDLEIPVDYKSRMLINFLGKSGSVLQLSYSDILEGRVQFDWEDKIVMIGATAMGLMDIKMTPLGQMPGIEYHATVLDNLMNENFIKRTSHLFDFLAIFTLSLITAGALIFLSPLVSAVITTIIVIGYLFASQFMFNEMSLWVAVVPPLWAVFLTFTAATVHHFSLEQREKKLIKSTFSRYLVPALVDELVKHPEKVSLGGEKKELTVLFSDIRNFTTWSESLPADVVMEQLNEYLDVMTDCVFDQEGMIDKYIGDAIMAIFGAPIYQTDQARRACRAALKMMEALKKLHLKWEAEGRSLLNIGIGINTGEMFVGNMGSQKIMNYTVIGDAVNLASRLESANKHYKTNIIISEFTYEKVKEEAVVKELGDATVKGRTQPIKLYELTGWKV